MLETIAATVASEFSDLGDVRQVTQLVVRMLLAALLGGLLGFERETSGKAAGVRTHMLVAMAAAMFVLLPSQAGMDDEALSRIIQGLLAGVGLLCAGSILKSEGDDKVRGLTTSAGLWMTTAIGVAIGLGRESSAVIMALLTWAVLALEAPLRRLTGRGS